MDFLTNALAFLNGNKTKIGAAIVAFGKVLVALGGPAELGTAIEQVGNVVVGLGLAHAAAKVAAGQPQA